jgi:cytoskeleton protein RodZ
MESLGNDLRVVREQKNLTLEQIADDTRIRAHYLQCLEEARYGDLPGGIYIRAFLRTYCDYLGIDSQAALEKLDTELSPPVEKPPRSTVRIPQASSSSRSSALIVWSAMLLVSVTGLYFSRTWIASVFSPYFSGPSLKPFVSPAAPATPISTPSMTEDTAPAIQRGAPTVPQDSPFESPPESSPKNLQPETPSPAPASLKIELEALEACWLSISTDGVHATSILLQPGNDQSFNASDHIYIILGNAGGVKVKINGKLTKTLGRSGEVVRLLINKQNLNDLIQDTVG